MNLNWNKWILAFALFCLTTTICYGANRHPIEQHNNNTLLAIFVHGFTGDYLETWGKLPELLQGDSSLDQYDFLFWGYPSSFFQQHEDIGTTGKYLKSEIDFLSKPYEKIVLIGHSMGGLVIRSYIVQALRDGKGKDLKVIADVVLFGVPNEGDLKADLVPTWVNNQIADLGVASKFITELRRYWIQRVTTAPKNDDFHQQIPTLAVAGYQDGFVSQQSVESFFRQTAMTDGNHRSMVKPETTSHLTYRIIHRRLLDAAKNPQRRAESMGTDVEAIVAKLIEKLKAKDKEQARSYQGEQVDSELIKSLTDAVRALDEKNRKPDAPVAIEVALDQLKQGSTQEAERIFEDILQRKENEGKRKVAEGQADIKVAAEAARHLGALAFFTDTNKALDAYGQAVSLEPDNFEGYDRLGRLLFRVGQIDEAKRVFRKLLRIAITQNDKRWTATGYSNIGNIYLFKNNITKSKEMYDKSLDIFKELNHKNGLARVYGSLGTIHRRIGELEKSESFLQKSIELSDLCCDRVILARSYGELATVYRLLGESEKATKMHQKSIDLFKSLDDKQGLAREYGNLAILYSEIEQLEGAIDLHKKSIELFQVLDDKHGLSIEYNILGEIYLWNSDFNHAKEIYHKALELSESLGQQEKMGYYYNVLGTIYQDLRAIEDAEAIYHKSLEINKIFLNKANIAVVYGNLGNLYSIDEDFEQAKTMYLEAATLFEEVGATSQVERIQNSLKSLPDAVPQ